jgi:hypothetical protein
LQYPCCLAKAAKSMGHLGMMKTETLRKSDFTHICTDV